MIFAVRTRLGYLIGLALSALFALSAPAAPDTPPDASAPGQTGRPMSAERVTRRFGFEQRLTNPGTLPRHWIRAQHDPPRRIRPGFPIWNQAELDYTVSAAGEGSVRLPTRGGSASLLLDPGVVPVFPDADYVVTAMVRTQGVDHARARLVARLLDAEGAALPGSEFTSDPIDTGGKWAHVLVRVPGNDPAAASLQIELLLEQPGPVGDLPFEDLEVVPEDFTGAAWFDEIMVVQVPRVELWTAAPGNLIPADKKPTVSLFLRDLVGKPLDIRFEALDLAGRVVDAEDVAFDGGRLEQTWVPALDRYGWYRVRVKIIQDGSPVGSAYTDLVWRSPIGDHPNARPRGSFSISVGGVPTEGMQELGDLTLRTGFARVLTDLWFEGAPADTDRAHALVDLSNRLTPVSRELGVMIPGLPAEVSDLRGARGPLDAIADPDNDGAAWLDPLLVDLGSRIRWWRIGAFGEALDGSVLPDLGPTVSRLRSLVPGAVLELPWSPFNRLGPGLVTPGIAVSEDLGPGVPEQEIAPVLAEFLDRAGQNGHAGWDIPRLTAVFRAEDQRRVGIGPSLDEMLRSAVYAWASLGENPRGHALRLDRGWRWQGGRRSQLMPNPSAAAWLTLAGMLDGRRAEPLERVIPGIEGMLLVPVDGARGVDPIAVLWPAADGATPPRIDLLLGDGPVRVTDRFGNSAAVEPGPIEPTAVLSHSLLWDKSPIYVEGVDADLLRFSASVHAEPGLIETRVEPDTLELVMENPWPSAIRGRYFLVEPGGLSTGDVRARDRGWKITPRQGPFAIDPGQSVRIPIEIEASAAVESGERPLVVDIDLTSPTYMGLLRIRRRVRMGLRDLTMHVSSRVSPGSGDLTVYAEITNTGDETQVVHAYASAPGFPRQRSAPTPLTPGQEVVKAFVFQAGGDALRGEDVGVGVFVREHGSRLRRMIHVD